MMEDQRKRSYDEEESRDKAKLKREGEGGSYDVGDVSDGNELNHDNMGEREMLSSIGAINYDTDKHESKIITNRKEGIDAEISPAPSKPEIKEMFTKPDVLNRNKRLFGSLMGHLGQAKQRIEKESAFLEMQQTKAQQAVERTSQEAKRAVEEKKRKAWETQLNGKIQAIKDKSKAWKERLESGAQFLMTETEPRLPWLPANHNPVTKEKLSKRNLETLRKIAERELADSKQIEELKRKFEEKFPHDRSAFQTSPNKDVSSRNEHASNSENNSHNDDAELA